MGIQLYGANGIAINALSTANAAQVVLVDALGNPITQTSGTNLPASPGFVAIGGRNDGAWRGARLDRYGNLRIGSDQMLFNDSCEGTTLNYALWAPSLTTWTVPTQLNPAGINIGAGANTTNANGAMIVSARQFTKVQQGPIRLRMRKRYVPQTNVVADFGFGSPTNAVTPIVPTGASWRYNSAGSVVPVISFNSSEITGADISTALAAAGGSSNYYSWEIIADDDQVIFICQDVSTGRSISEQTLNIPLAQSRAWQTTHLPIFDRMYNVGVPGASPITHNYLSDCMVVLYDVNRQQPWSHVQSALGLNGSVNPVTYVQAQTYTIGAAPGASTMTASTAPATATLGGLFQFTMIAGGESDYPMFAFQVPAPLKYYCTGVHIGSMVVLSLATGLTAPVIAQWGVAVNSSAASLATTTTVGTSYMPNKMAIGTQTLAGVAVATVGTIIGPDLDWHPGTPLVALPGRWIHAILRLPIVGAAGTTCVVRGNVTFDGYFE